MALHPWIDPDDPHLTGPGPSDPHNLGMAVIDDEDGLLVDLDSDDPEDRELYEMVIRTHPDGRPDCPGRQ